MQLDAKRVLDESGIRVPFEFEGIPAAEDFPYELIPNGRDYPFRKMARRFYFYETEDGVIWGLTAELLFHFLELLR